MDVLGHLDDVGPGLPVDGYDHRSCWNIIASGPHPHVYAFVLNRFAHSGDVAQIDGRSVRYADDQIAVLLGSLELSLGTQQRRAARPVELARAGITRSVPDRIRHVVHRCAARPHGRRVRFDPYGRLGPKYVHTADAGDYAESLSDLRARITV